MIPLELRNTQPAEPRLADREDGALEVHSVFLTLQGEGPFAGTPAVFVRLAGCNLTGDLSGGRSTCPACDTAYTEGRKLVKPQDLLEQVKDTGNENIKLVVITGGEPFRQGLARFVEKLLWYYSHVQIETNGTLYRKDFPWDDNGLSIVCSPKTPRLHHEIAPYISAYKYILQAGQVDPKDGLPLTTMGGTKRPARPLLRAQSGRYLEQVYVQPLDEQDPEKNAANAKAAVESCLKFGYKLSYQVHKLLGLA